MKWDEKLRRLLVDKNVSAISKAVGLHPARLGTQIALGQMPRADRAVRLAIQLGVDTDWLFDDREGWPPRQIEVGMTPSGSTVTVTPKKRSRELQVFIVRRGRFEGRSNLRLLGVTERIEPEDYRGESGWVPVLAPVAAGVPREAHDQGYPIGAAEGYVRFDAADSTAFALTVDGDSMAPDFRHGDVVIASPQLGQSRDTYRDGMIAVVIFGGDRTATLKRVRFGAIRRSDDEPMDYVLEPINPHFPKLRLKRGEITAIYPVIGLIRREAT